MAKKTESRKIIDKLLILFGSVAMAALLALGGLAWWASSFISGQVHDQLSAQKIYFPPKGSPALNPQEFPGLQQYAGQPVDNAAKAKAYADEFIAVHLDEIADGKTYSEVSRAAAANPDDQALQQQKATLFQGQTLRGLLLGNAYAFGTMGDIARMAAIAALAAAAAMGVLVLLGLRHLKRLG